MAHNSHVICACYQNMPKTCLPRVNLRQLTLLKGYIHSNEQPVAFIPYILCVSLQIDEFTFIAHAQKRHPESV